MESDSHSPFAAPSEHWAVLHFLGRLRPELSTSQILEALPESPLPSSLGLRGTLEHAAERLGLSLIELETHGSEIGRHEKRLPALWLGPEPLVLESVGRAHVVATDGAGARRRIDIKDWGKSETLTLIFASPLRPLDVLRHRRPVGRLIAYLRGDSSLVQLVLSYAVGVELLSLAIPLTVQILINTIGFGTLVQPLVVLAGVLLVALTGAATLRLLQTIAVEHMARRFVQRVIMDLAERLPLLRKRSGTPRYPEHRFFEIASVDKAFFIFGLDLLGLMLQVIAATLLLAFYHPLLLTFALGLAFCAWAAVRLPFSRALSHSLAESAAKYDLAEWFSLRSERSSLEDDSLQQHRLTQRWLQARDGVFRITLRQQLALFAIQVVFSTLLLLVGGRLVIAGQLTLGQLVAAELVTTAALLSLSKLGKQLPKIYDLITSFEKLGVLVDSSMPGPTPAPGPHPEAHQNLSPDRLALLAASTVLPPGERR